MLRILLTISSSFACFETLMALCLRTWFVSLYRNLSPLVYQQLNMRVLMAFACLSKPSNGQASIQRDTLATDNSVAGHTSGPARDAARNLLPAT